MSKKSQFGITLLLSTIIVGGAKASTVPTSNTLGATMIAQQGAVCKGVVKDAAGEPIIGASVSVKGTKNATVTDVEGRFTLNVNSSNGIIIVSYIGFQTQEVKFSDNKALDIHLKEDSQTLGDVVVTAFGATQKKETVVGSVQQVKPESLRVPSASISSSFAGRLSGVIATQSSGQPGANGSDFYIP